MHRAVAFVPALVAILACAAPSQTLLKNINPYLVNGNGVAATTTPVVVVGTNAYFPANDGVNGVELWVTDSTTGGTVMVKDINATALGANSTPAGLTAYGAGFIFSATDGVNGIELWKSDGTAAGTVMAFDIYPGANTSSSPSGFVVIGTDVYFAATDATVTTGPGRELYKYDGTTVTLVKDIFVGTSSGISLTGNSGSNNNVPILHMVAIGTTFYFAANDGTNGVELWKSDGTNAGTVMVTNIAAAGTSGSPTLLVAFGSNVIFSANDAINGIEPWISDGTPAGTVMLKDIYPGASLSSSPTAFVAAGTKCYFTALDNTPVTGTGRELYVTDGTPAGTSLVIDMWPGLFSGASTIGLFAIGSNILYAGQSPANGSEGYLSDGTAAGTSLYADFTPGAGNGFPAPFFAYGGKIYANATDSSYAGGNFELMVTDGTPAGTGVVKDIWPGGASSDAQGFFICNGKLCMFANDGVSGIELWRSDGTTAGTVLVKDINPVGGTAASSSPGPMVKLNGKAYFAANDGALGAELWVTDGTTAGTQLFKDINTFGTGAGTPANLTLVGNKIFFSANDGMNGIELWVCDGTVAGTVMVKDINTTLPFASSSPASFVAVGNRLYFTANDGVSGVELWTSDGTAAGTILLKDIVPGTGTSSPSLLTAFGSKLWFRANDSVVNGQEPWISDGTPAGTVMLKDCYAGLSSSNPVNPTVSGAKLFFVASDFTPTTGLGTELYVTDGTPAGTSLIDVQVGVLNGLVTTAGTIVKFGNGVLFQGNNGTAVNNAELWFSDGTIAGTTMVKDINVGAVAASPANMTAFGSLVLFSATTAAAGNEPWVTDGTPGGTILLGDLYPGTASSSPTSFVNAAGAGFFVAANSTAVTGTGREYYVTDGTALGTVLAKDCFPGLSSGASSVPFAIGAGKRVIFSATDGVAGVEPWLSDGTPAGSYMLLDIQPGSVTSSPANYIAVGDRLVFSANNGTSILTNPAAVGIELWSVPLATLGICEAEVYGSSCQGTGTPTIGTSGGAPFAGNAAFNVDVSNAAPSAPAALYLNSTRGDVPIGPCTIYPSLVPVIAVSTTTNASGAASINLSIPPGAWNIGIQLHFQYVIVDVGGPILGLASSTAGLRIRIGAS